MSRRAKSCPVHRLGVQGREGHPGACGTCSSHSPSPATDAFPKPLTVLLSITQHVPSSLILQSMHSYPKRPLPQGEPVPSCVGYSGPVKGQEVASEAGSLGALSRPSY